MSSVCFLSAGDGMYADILQGLVASFHRVGMTHDFYAFSDQLIHGATHTYRIEQVSGSGWWYKYDFLQSLMDLNHKAFIWVDADCFFRRNADRLAELALQHPALVFLEDDLAQLPQAAWYGISGGPRILCLVQECGLASDKFCHTNGGLLGVQKKHFPVFMDLCRRLRERWLGAGGQIGDEYCSAFAAQVLGQPPSLYEHTDLWGIDSLDCFVARLPANEPMFMKKWFRPEETISIDPALIHLYAAKSLLAAERRRQRRWFVRHGAFARVRRRNGD